MLKSSHLNNVPDVKKNISLTVASKTQHCISVTWRAT